MKQDISLTLAKNDLILHHFFTLHGIQILFDKGNILNKDTLSGAGVLNRNEHVRIDHLYI